MKIKILILLAMILSSCTEKVQEHTIAVTANVGTFEVNVRARGELRAKSDMPIVAPVSNMNVLRLKWLRPENSRVKKGDLLAQFDASRFELGKQRAMWNLQKHGLAKDNTQMRLQIEQLAMIGERDVVGAELKMSERFSVDDLMVYSKNEIADKMLDKEYLGAKKDYLQWRDNTSKAQGDAQLAVHQVKEKAEKNTIERADQVLKQLNIHAPQDGIFVYQQNWFGEKVKVGQQLWAGQKLGSIPNLSVLQARLHVLENEALGVAQGQSVSLRLDAYPELELQGEVLSVSSVASPLSRENPSNYFEVIVSLELENNASIRPGQRAKAKILVLKKENALTVPRQSLFTKDGLYWVYVDTDDGYQKRLVKLGQRSLSRVEVVSGIEDGERIALSKPENIVGS